MYELKPSMIVRMPGCHMGSSCTHSKGERALSCTASAHMPKPTRHVACRT